MTNLKKTLAVVLAFAMILSMGLTSMAAYSDVTAGTKVSEAVDILSNLGILTGFEDGTFKPEETVTRAQMAAIICRTLGYEDQAKSSMGSTIFNDVAADHWAAGYINVAQSLQIVNGYGDGNFGPEDQVTYEQAVKMIVVALGYELDAQAKGGYPTGYLAVASREGVTKNANGLVGSAASRGTIAVLVYNSLEVPLMEQSEWSTGEDGDKFGIKNKTILSWYLDIEKWEGIVKTTPLTAATSSYKKDDAPMLMLDNASKWQFSNNSYTLLAGSFNNGNNVDASRVDDVNQYLGKKVVAYIGEEADYTTGNVMLYAIAEKNGANNSITINGAQLVSNDTTANKLAYKKVGSNKVYDVTLSTAATGYVNFASKTNAELAAADGTNTTVLATEDLATLLPNGGSIELIDNNATNAGYDTLIITKYDKESVIEAVETVRGDVKFETYADLDTIKKFDTEADDELAVVYKDGQVASIEDIAEGDTVTVAQVNGDYVRVFYVSSASVTGAVEGYATPDTENEVYIGGETYKLSKKSPYYNQASTKLKNKEGLFFLNVDGMITYADASAAKGNYGLILSVGKSGSMGKYAVNVALADGTVATYDLASKLTWNTATSQAADVVAGNIATIMAATAGTKVNTGSGYTAAEAYAHTDKASELLCEVKLNNNSEVKSIVQLSTSNVTPSGTSKYSAETMTVGSKSFDEASVMFALKGTRTDNSKIEDTDVQVGKVTTLLADEESYALAAFDYENKVYSVALGYDLVASIPVDSDAVIVSSKSVRSYNDDSAVMIEGIQGGEEVSYIIYNENGFKSAVGDLTHGGTYNADATEIGIGDVILVSTPDAEGVVADFQMLYKKNASNHYSAGYLAADNATKDVYYHAAAVDEQVAPSADFIWFVTGKSNVTEGTTRGTDAYVVMQRAANYTLVDYTEVPAGAAPEIFAESANKSLVGDIGENHTNYQYQGTEDSFVFVRVVDEKLAEVVVYRTK